MTADEGALIETDGRPTLRFERHLAASAERVWRAVTDEQEMKAWFPSTVEGERRAGAPLRFVDDPNLTGTTGRVLEWDPPRTFAFDWNGDELRIDVTPDGDGSILVFSHRVLDRSIAARNGSGWHVCLASLDAHLGGGEDAADWRGLYAGYLERMGPPLGTPGDDGSMSWERWHHVSPADFDAGFANAAAWGADASSLEDLECTRSAGERGTRYRVTHRSAGHDPDRAARWHALLTQLDMFLASKQLVPADPALFVDAYRALLS